MKFLPAASFMLEPSRDGSPGELQDATVSRRVNTLAKSSATAADVTRAAALYFQPSFAGTTDALRDAGQGARAVRRSTRTASCLRAFVPRSSRRNTTNRPSHQPRLI